MLIEVSTDEHARQDAIKWAQGAPRGSVLLGWVDMDPLGSGAALARRHALVRLLSGRLLAVRGTSWRSVAGLRLEQP